MESNETYTRWYLWLRDHASAEDIEAFKQRRTTSIAADRICANAAPTPPKSASVPVERLEALIKESEGCRDYVTLIELVELLAEYK